MVAVVVAVGVGVGVAVGVVVAVVVAVAVAVRGGTMTNNQEGDVWDGDVTCWGQRCPARVAILPDSTSRLPHACDRGMPVCSWCGTAPNPLVATVQGEKQEGGDDG